MGAQVQLGGQVGDRYPWDGRCRHGSGPGAYWMPNPMKHAATSGRLAALRRKAVTQNGSLLPPGFSAISVTESLGRLPTNNLILLSVRTPLRTFGTLYGSARS